MKFNIIAIFIRILHNLNITIFMRREKYLYDFYQFVFYYYVLDI